MGRDLDPFREPVPDEGSVAGSHTQTAGAVPEGQGPGVRDAGAARGPEDHAQPLGAPRSPHDGVVDPPFALEVEADPDRDR